MKDLEKLARERAEETIDCVFEEDKPVFINGYIEGYNEAKKPAPYTRKAMIYFYGDPSVGIQSYSFDVEIHSTSLDDREFTRKQLRECYKQIDGEFTPTVIFDDEQLD